jgi:hypothetical protein
MLYLLVMLPTMMSAVAGIGQKRFIDTCKDAQNNFFDFLGRETYQEYKQNFTRSIEELQRNPRKPSLLFDASDLAKELGNLEWQKRWGVMSQVWVELLSYAASHCRANTHAAQLSQGGEFFTFVWLLMSHFGIGDQIQILEGPTRAN